MFDVSGEFRVLCSGSRMTDWLISFQKEARLVFPRSTTRPPIIHLPLSIPSPSSHRLTGWVTIAIHLSPLLPHFGALAARQNESDDERHHPELPGDRFASVTYLSIHANCRLRRIWSSATAPSEGAIPWEFGLFSSG